MENPDLVEMTVTYTKHPDGSITEVRKIGDQVIYSGPSPIVFVDVFKAFPWEVKDDGNRPSDKGAA